MVPPFSFKAGILPDVVLLPKTSSRQRRSADREEATLHVEGNIPVTRTLEAFVRKEKGAGSKSCSRPTTPMPQLWWPGAPLCSRHDFLDGRLRAALVADPDGNPHRTRPAEKLRRRAHDGRLASQIGVRHCVVMELACPPGSTSREEAALKLGGRRVPRPRRRSTRRYRVGEPARRSLGGPERMNPGARGAVARGVQARGAGARP
jgi:hypothetical protein